MFWLTNSEIRLIEKRAEQYTAYINADGQARSPKLGPEKEDGPFGMKRLVKHYAEGGVLGKRLKAGKKSLTKNHDLGEKFSKQYGIFNVVENSNNADVINVLSIIVSEMLEWEEPRATTKRRIANGWLAAVRNPIIRGDYGGNTEKRKKWKTFDKLMVATGTFFRSLKCTLNQ